MQASAPYSLHRDRVFWDLFSRRDLAVTPRIEESRSESQSCTWDRDRRTLSRDRTSQRMFTPKSNTETKEKNQYKWCFLLVQVADCEASAETWLLAPMAVGTCCSAPLCVARARHVCITCAAERRENRRRERSETGVRQEGERGGGISACWCVTAPKNTEEGQ